MPAFKSNLSLGLRGLKAFFNLEAGLTQGRVPGRYNGKPSGQDVQLEQARKTTRSQKQQLEDKDRRIDELQRELSEYKETLNEYKESEKSSGVRPENIVWIFGTGRSGSTWLRSIMGDSNNHLVWEEPLVGKLFGKFHDTAQQGQLGSANFILGTPIRASWEKGIRQFVLEALKGRFPNASSSDKVLVKEPNGSIGAPLLMEALPESRMILLVRDPRDVVASVLDASKKGSWLYERKEDRKGWKAKAVADDSPNNFAENRAGVYLQDVGNAQQAYELHRGPKVVARYEDLVSDTLKEMRRIYSELGMEISEEALSRTVDKHSWDNIPEENKGMGKFYRRGASGGWREDLSAEQLRIVEEITAPFLEQFYPKSYGEQA